MYHKGLPEFKCAVRSRPDRGPTVGCFYASGNYARNKWMTLSGKKYYFKNDAIMKTGWLGQSGKLYYFDSSGAMANGNKTINGHVYQFGADGVFVKKVK